MFRGMVVEIEVKNVEERSLAISVEGGEKGVEVS